ncbi:MAG TPA: amylo-alpha-1,6-glucosidase [Candidatus Cloacimonadota bacterium]|nr:amylo-alpha-1,6-glucosidase [Candidatus Cloacimonadota bacterium]HPS39364.1 amylo-alpha-1,6-glucosidase [Candidatus Cloacimonadota bacterium]
MNSYFMETHHHEWILTNKLGSYALGTGNLINQRKYHGLLIAGDRNFNRKHLVAGIEEKVEWRGELIHLDSNNYSNCIYPEGFMYLVKPWLRPYPVFLYSALPHQNDILIRKELMMAEDSNTILVKYTNLGHHRLHFNLQPKFTMLPHHELNYPGSLDNEEFETNISIDMDGGRFSTCRRSNGISAYGAIAKGIVEENRYVYYNVYYPWEVMSGYAGVGDQISLFDLSFDLKVNESNYILFSDKPIENANRSIQEIEKRYENLPKPMDYPAVADEDDTLLSSLDYNDNKQFKRAEYLKILSFCLKDFLVNDDIVRGYPYYGAWGRDTMFVLNALLHLPGNLDAIETVLRKYSRHIKDGLIPNVFAETGRTVNYDSVDATLWYVILLWKVGKKKNNLTYWKEVLLITEGILKGIIENHIHSFRIREDGLIELLPDFAHATWMDVRIEGKAVVPRDGAPVEINALWFNALSVYMEMSQSYSEISGEKHSALGKITELLPMVKRSLTKFWADGWLADRLVGEDKIMEVRPNVLLALSLPIDFLEQEQLQQVFERAKAELYTKYGIRTLSPGDVRFRKKYYGNQKERDTSRHNGSVQAWLLSPYCGLYVKAYRGIRTDAEVSAELAEIISAFTNGFMKGHIASVAEIWDGENPHFPKGAPAHAMSVAAVYNIESFIETLEVKP